MKLSQFVSEVSTLDEFTVRHLKQWCASGRAPTSEDPDTVSARMIVFLEALPSEDREYFIGRGWLAAFDEMEGQRQ